MRTSRRLIDACLIKGRLVDGSGSPIAGEALIWIPGQHRGKRIRILSNGKFVIKVNDYPHQDIRIEFIGGGTTVVHTLPYIFKKGIYGGYKVTDLGNITLGGGGRDLIWFVMGYVVPN